MIRLTRLTVVTKTLFLLRHAQTEDTRPGGRDSDRRLTSAGEAQARAVGEWLRDQPAVDVALCSTAVRTRQTLAACAPNARAEFLDALYNDGSDALLAAIRELPETVEAALVVGHAPAVPGLVHELTDPQTSDPAAVAAIDSRYPAATLAVLAFEDTWADLTSAALVRVRLPADQ
jgi:phosphohistidine phosphatase